MCICKLFYKMLLKNLKMLSFCEKIRKNACRLIIILYLCSANTKYEIEMSNLIKPEGYKALLDMRQTEMGIKMIKEFFQQNLSTELRLRRVTAPLFVLKGLGINDDLNGVERPVSFPIKDLGEARLRWFILLPSGSD